MNTQATFSSARHNWKTPKAFYRALDTEFLFDFDPCPTNPKFDGIHTDWGESNYVNPPYNEIKHWLAKSIDEWRNGKTVVLLLPSRTGTEWFHRLVLPLATEIRFIRGRLQFDDSGCNAPFDSMIVIFRSGDK